MTGIFLRKIVFKIVDDACLNVIFSGTKEGMIFRYARVFIEDIHSFFVETTVRTFNPILFRTETYVPFAGVRIR